MRRWLKKWGYSWKRMRRSLKNQRDQELFENAQSDLQHHHYQEDKELIDVYYFDEMGINLIPSVPYGWQQKGERIELPSTRSRNQTVLGFMNKKLKFYPYLFEGAANTDVVIECFDRFVEHIEKETIVVLDNASIHRSNRFMDKQEEWKQKGLKLFFIPPYSPELNLIERLWKEIKYNWLKPQFIKTKKQLENQLLYVLKNIGEKFTISFV